jgi:hypothetical protein
MITYFLIVYCESTESWHIADKYQTSRNVHYATAILHNTHPRLCGLWAVVAECDLEEAISNTPESLFAY